MKVLATSTKQQSFGMALKRPFSKEVNEYLLKKDIGCSPDYLSNTIESVTKQQKNNKKYDIITAIKTNHHASSGDKPDFVAIVVNKKNGTGMYEVSQSDMGNVAGTIKRAGEDATLRATLDKTSGNSLFSKIFTVLKNMKKKLFEGGFTVAKIETTITKYK